MRESDIFLNKIDSINNIPTLPAIAVEINALVKNSTTTIDFLSSTIEKDQAIVTKLLRLVNSSFFGLRSKVSTVSEAVIMLGFNSINNIVLSISVIKIFSGNRFNIAGFWKHSLAVAILSRHIAVRLNPQVSEDCFTGGLLHDLGKVILMNFFKSEFIFITIKMKQENKSFRLAEKEVIPAGHAEIGSHLAKKWLFPKKLSESIRVHHQMQTLPKSTPNYDLFVIINVANIICNCLFSKKTTAVKKSMFTSYELKKFNQTLYNIKAWYPKIEKDISDACVFFLKDGKG